MSNVNCKIMNEIKGEEIEILTKTVEDLVFRMGVEVKTSARIDEKDGEEVACLNIEADDANYLIGQRGFNLNAIQHLTKVFLKKKGEIDIPFCIDVNNYRREKEEYLQALALETEEKVKRMNKEVILRPMTGYERRIVHMKLAESEYVETLSIGEEPNRKVVVKPKVNG